MNLNRFNNTHKKAFTLIEVLVVIAIMGLLAAMLIGGSGMAGEKRKRAAVQAGLTALEGAIDSYYAELNSYPPDNPTNTAQPPLFYELYGATFDPSNNTYSVIGQNEQIPRAAVGTFFGRGGFLNSNPESTKNFLKGVEHAVKYAEISASPDVEVFVVPVEGPAPYNAKGKNPWRYRQKGVKNPAKYDLWAEVVIGGKTNIIGNWKE
jgi:prepilin-type N-terminal cleavage/methylation domain-containing protein